MVFYDYTKVPGREVPANYRLTFSLSESNDRDALASLAAGRNVAVVLDLGRGEGLPASWSGYPVLDGDAHDFRFLDPKGGHIIGLWAKGEARHDATGFVRPVDGRLDPGRVRILARHLEREAGAETLTTASPGAGEESTG